MTKVTVFQETWPERARTYSSRAQAFRCDCIYASAVEITARENLWRRFCRFFFGSPFKFD